MMRIFRIVALSLAATILFTSSSLCSFTPPHYIYANEPEYAKWGQIAMEQVKARYRIPVVDYLHVGRTEVSPGIAEEKFRLWLKDNKREFGVIVSIRFHTANDQIIDIRLQETPGNR